MKKAEYQVVLNFYSADGSIPAEVFRMYVANLKAKEAPEECYGVQLKKAGRVTASYYDEPSKRKPMKVTDEDDHPSTILFPRADK